MLALSVLISFQATAAQVWSTPSTISLIETVGSDGGFIIYLSQLPPSCNAAGPNSLYIYPNHNSVTTDGVKMLMTTAFLAFSTGKKVSMMYDDSSAYCWGVYMVIQQ